MAIAMYVRSHRVLLFLVVTVPLEEIAAVSLPKRFDDELTDTCEGPCKDASADCFS